MTARSYAARGAVARVLACSMVVVAAMTGLVLSTAQAQPSGDDAPSLALVDQDIVVEPDGTFRLTFRIDGDLDGLDFPMPTTTTTTTTSTTTTTTTSTTTTTTTTLAPSPGQAPSVPATTNVDDAGSPPAPTTVPATTTTTPPPEPVAVAIDVINYRPLERTDTAIDTIDEIVGPTSRLDVLGPSIDGVRFDDVRQLVTFDGDQPIVVLDIASDGTAAPSVEDRLEMTEPGLTPIRVELRVDDRVIAAYGTVIDRLAGATDGLDPTTPIDLSVVALVPRPDVEATDPMAVVDGVASPAATAEILAATTDSFDALTRLVDGVDVPVLAEIAPVVLGTHLDARDDLDALRTTFADTELVAVAIGSLDVSSAVTVGLIDAVGRQLALGEEALTDWLPLTPTRRDVWIATDPISANGAQVLRNLGYRSIVMTPELAATLLGGPTDDEPPPITDRFITDRFIAVPLPDGRTINVIVIDPLSNDLTPAATDATLAESTALEWAVRTATAMLLDHRRSDGSIERSRVLSTPDLTAPDPRLVAALAAVAERTPSLRFMRATTLAGVTDTAPVTDREFPATAGLDLTERVERIGETSLALSSAGSMLATDDRRSDVWQATLDSLLSTSVRDDTADDVLDGLLDEAAALVDAVQLPDPFRFTLTGRSGVIPIRLVNTSDGPLTITLRLSSPKLEFPDGDELVTLRPNDETDVPVRVAARSNGTSAITLDVLTPLGGQIGEPVTIISRVNSLTGFGQVLTGGFVLMLLAWWFNNWRARRRPERDDGDDPDDRDDPDDPARHDDPDPDHHGAQTGVVEAGQ